MRVRVLSLAALALAFSCPLVANGHQEQKETAAQGPTKVTINGRTHPDLLPAHLVWESFFRSILSYVRDEDGNVAEDKVSALAKHNLKIPVSEVRAVLQVAEETVKRCSELREPLDKEHATGVDLGWTLEKRRAQVQASMQVIVDGRDELTYKLSRKSFSAVKHYVATAIAPGTVMDIYLPIR